MKKKIKCCVCHKEIDNEEEAMVFKGLIAHEGECIRTIIDKYNANRRLEIKNKQLEHQLKQKEDIIEEAKTFIENKIEYLKKCKYFKVVFYDEDNMKHEWNEQLLYKENELLKILDDLSKGE